MEAFKTYTAKKLDPFLQDLIQRMVVARPADPEAFLIEMLTKGSGGSADAALAALGERRLVDEVNRLKSRVMELEAETMRLTAALKANGISSSEVAAPAVDELVIVHFNDVYNIEPREREPCGGAARFCTRLKSMRADGENPLVLFSGDAFAPSIMSTVTKGKQMPPCLNSLGIHTAVFGNHDFDFGLATLSKLSEATNFPWLMSNCIDKHTGRPLGDGIVSRVFEWAGHKIGLMGLIEQEWLATLATIEIDEVEYTDFVARAKQLAPELRAQGAEIVIALTHMRVPNDERLAREAPELDLILGGHDHHYEVKVVEGTNTLLCKSGTDFRDMTKVRIKFGKAGKPPSSWQGSKELVPPLPGARPSVLSHEHLEITSDIMEDAEVKAIVSKYQEIVGESMERVIGETAVPLDAQFRHIRTRETNIGNFICDIIRDAAKADIMLLNSGTIRSDTVHPVGKLRMKDLVAMLPMCDEIAVLDMTGAQVVEALENAVSMYPRLEGRFAQVSGVAFTFDPSRPKGARVVAGSVRVGAGAVGGAAIDLEAHYKVCVKEYLVQGKDGYDMFPHCPVLVDGESLPTIPDCVRNHLIALSHLNGHKKVGAGCQSTATLRNYSQFGPDCLLFLSVSLSLSLSLQRHFECSALEPNAATALLFI